jgi:hypothetical protein
MVENRICLTVVSQTIEHDQVGPTIRGRARHLTLSPLWMSAGQLRPRFHRRKSLRDLSTLAQVREAVTTRFLTGPAYVTRDVNNQEVVAAYARVAGPGWLVFVEFPIEEWTKY